MRLNRYIAQSTGLSRRKADELLSQNRIKINNIVATIGDIANENDIITLDDKILSLPKKQTVLMLNKPIGYTVSRNGQGSKTIYNLLPKKYHDLKPIGRLDKNSSGLLLLTNNGNLAFELTHPKYQKIKTYQILLNKNLTPLHHQIINNYGVNLEDGLSKLTLIKTKDNNKEWTVKMSEGRNKQIRRTFSSLGYKIITLHRTTFGQYNLNNLPIGQFEIIKQ